MRQEEEEEDQLIIPRNIKLHVHAPPQPPHTSSNVHLISMQR